MQAVLDQRAPSRLLFPPGVEMPDAVAHGIVGRSPALRRALQGVTQVAATHATVLLLGETGTGKELFARALHDRSTRRERPLVKVNCAAIPATLIESEFFGHERGAFTGATQRREGRFALADGGTIFLDEIGELPLELQGKLLRALQEGEFEPVGGSRTRKVNVRVIAATNRDLQDAVWSGAFREDLFYRLSVFPLRLPPLRERGDDVVLLATSLAEKLAAALGRRVAPLSPADAAALRAYRWPGNVRELRNVIERAIITSPDGRLHLDRVLPHSGAEPGPASPSAGASADGREIPTEILTERRLRQLERANMLAALERAGWRVAGEGGAAALLDVSPSTLKSRMKALEIRRPGTVPQESAAGA
jgi:transcriptional regulator with GAF, ATPase, and Fis domain